ANVQGGGVGARMALDSERLLEEGEWVDAPLLLEGTRLVEVFVATEHEAAPGPGHHDVAVSIWEVGSIDRQIHAIGGTDGVKLLVRLQLAVERAFELDHLGDFATHGQRERVGRL